MGNCNIAKIPEFLYGVFDLRPLLHIDNPFSPDARVGMPRFAAGRRKRQG